MTAPTEPAPPPPLLTPAAAARLLGIRVRTLARWDERGLITAVRAPGRPNSHRRYRLSDVTALIEGAD